MSVLLLSYIDRLAVELEDACEARWREVLLLRLLEISKDVLKLLKNLKDRLLSKLLLINFSLQDSFSQIWYHEKLLD